MNRLDFTAENVENNVRIDKWLSEQDCGVSRSMLQRLLKEDKITVNGKPIGKSYQLKCGDIVCVDIPDPEPLDVAPENIPLEIVYSDDHLLVVNKPKGMVVHPAAGNYSGTMVNALLYHCGEQLSSINGVIRPGIVHRIDKNTSGLLIVAKTDTAHQKLAEQIKAHTFTREYHAVVCGKFKEPVGIIDAPIGRHPVDRKKMCVTDKNSKEARTEYTVLDEFDNYSYVKLKLFTGRTHQIRVHMSYIGHPVFGDDVYGKPSKYCEGQCLHAKKIGFIHPDDGKYYEFDSELPGYFKFVLNKLSGGRI